MTRGDADRAQTTLDYAVGVSLFLLTVALVVAFVPSMFDPFADAQDGSVVADRAATQLSSDVLGDPAAPYALNETCVAEFFGGTPGAPVPAACEFDASRGLHPTLGIDSTVGLNATLERGGSVRYASGPPPSPGTTVVTAQRLVEVGDRSYRLYVRVW